MTFAGKTIVIFFRLISPSPNLGECVGNEVDIVLVWILFLLPLHCISSEMNI